MAPPQVSDPDHSPELAANLQRIHQSAEHQLRVINDLLDLSRAEIDELDLHTELLDPRGLLSDTFAMLADESATLADASASVAQDGDAAGGVTWKLELPDRLPLVRADPVRIRQILLNLLSNARKFTTHGHIVLRADTTPAHLHIAVQDSGAGIPVEQQERIFEPFVTSEYQMDGRLHGIGLGLSITRRLVTLHGGSMRVESRPGEGSTFHVYLPWPSISDRPAAKQDAAQALLIVISTPEGEQDELRELAARAGLAIRYVRGEDDLDDIGAPAVLAWDLGARSPGDWGLLRRLRSHPALAEAPFILYGLRTGSEPGEPSQMVNFLVKPAGEPALLDTIRSTLGAEPSGPVLIVDDDPAILEQYREIVERNFPRYEVRSAADGEAAVALMETVTPALVLLDLMLPGIDGFAVLDWMRSGERTRQAPVIILSTRQLNSEDVRRLESHAQVAFQTKGILSENEMAAAVDRALGGEEPLPKHTSALVKRAIAYLQQNYAHPIARWQVAEAAGASEDYLSRLFHRELGLSPWDYLNRYRIQRARLLLVAGDLSIAEVARQVGFKDHAYFSRIFRKLTGLSPNGYREDARR